ncbi:MAG: hypothetical protein Q7N87_00485 [Candidatus Uhrbacteria bacterium]|nr:hypothetical protein [Candidatus Uhrbacteria bacterium]
MIAILIGLAVIFGFPIFTAVLRARGYVPLARALDGAIRRVGASALHASHVALTAVRDGWNLMIPTLSRKILWLMVVLIGVFGFTAFIYACDVGNWGKGLLFILIPALLAMYWMLCVLYPRLMPIRLIRLYITFDMTAPAPGVPIWFSPSLALNSVLSVQVGLGFLWLIIGLWIHSTHTTGWEHNGLPVSFVGAVLILMALFLVDALGRFIAAVAAKGVHFTEVVSGWVLLVIEAAITKSKDVVKKLSDPASAFNLAREELFGKAWQGVMDGIKSGLYPVLAVTLLFMNFAAFFAISFLGFITFLILGNLLSTNRTPEREQKILNWKATTALTFTIAMYIVLTARIGYMMIPGFEAVFDGFIATATFFILSLVGAAIHIVNWVVEFGKGDRSISALMTWKSAAIGLVGFGLLLTLLLRVKPKDKPAVGTPDPHSFWRRAWYVLVVPSGLFALGFALCLIFTGVAKNSNAYADSLSIHGLAVEKMPFMNVSKIESTPGWDFSWHPVPNAIGYKLERRLDGTKDFQPVRGADWLKAHVHHWADTDIKPGEKWYYQLRAIYNGRLSEPTDEYWMIWPDPNWKPSASTPDGGVPAAPSSPVAPPVPAAGAPDGGVSTQTGEDPEAFGKFLDTL